MKQHKYLVLLLLLFFCLGNAKWASEERAYATVEITALTTTGESVDGTISDLSRRGDNVIDLVQPHTNKSFRANFRGTKVSDIPYGNYILRLTVPGFKNYEQPLRVYQPLVSVRICLNVSEIGGTSIPVINGTVMPISSVSSNLWVKLMPILGNNFMMESRVQSNGSFRLAGFDDGEYLLVLIRGTVVIYSKQVYLGGRENNIDLLLTN